VAVGLAASLVGGLGYALLREEPAEAPVPVAVAEPAPPATEPQTVTLRVESRPEGAEVRLGSKVLGTTPVSAELPRNVQSAIDVGMEGFESQRHVIAGEADERIVVALRPVAEQAEPEPEPQPKPAPVRRKRRRPRKAASKPAESSSPFRRFE
jgi:hypothetical protein